VHTLFYFIGNVRKCKENHLSDPSKKEGERIAFFISLKIFTEL